MTTQTILEIPTAPLLRATRIADSIRGGGGAVNPLADFCKLHLTPTDLTFSYFAKAQSFLTKIAIEDGGNGIYCLPVQKLCNVLARCGDMVGIEVNDDKARLTNKRSRFILDTMAPDDYPEYDQEDCKHIFNVASGSAFHSALSLATAGRGESGGRFSTDGICFACDAAGSLDVVGTDGRKIVVASMPADVEVAEGFKVILPGDYIKTLLAISKDAAGLSMGMTGNNLMFESGRDCYVCGSLEGIFPPYMRAVGAKSSSGMAISRVDLLEGFRDSIASSADLESDEVHTCWLRASDGMLTCENEKTGTNVDVCPVPPGKLQEVRINPAHIVQMLGKMTAESLDVSFGQMFRVDAPAVILALAQIAVEA